MAPGTASDAATASPTPDGIVARPAGPSDLGDAARVLVAAFPREFHLVFSSRQRTAEEVIHHLLCCDYAEGRGIWVARDGERTIGAMLLESPPQFRQRHTWRLALHVAWRHVGLRGLPRLALVLLLPRYAPQPGEVYVRAIGVTPPYRGRGAGTLLLRCAEDWGRQHHKKWLGLHVNSGNARAHALYRRMGYADRGCRLSLLMWLTLRQRGSRYMTKPLRNTRG